MAYELANLESFSPQTTQVPTMREEKTIESFADHKARVAAAMAKAAGTTTDAPVKTDAPITNDNAAAEPAKVDEVSRPLSPQLAALARKEQKFREEQRKLKVAEQALEAERKEIAELKELKAKLAAGDYSAADKLVDYEKYTQHKLGKDPKAEELESLRTDIAKLKADQEKDLNERFESAVNQRRVAIKTLMATDDASQFKAIKELKAEEAVVQHILDTWENDSVELTPEDAAKEVEAALKEKAQKWASIYETKKEPTTEVVPAIETVEKRELPPLKTGMKTLTNNMASTGQIKPPVRPLHLMTEQERYVEARRRYEEKLKQGLR